MLMGGGMENQQGGIIGDAERMLMGGGMGNQQGGFPGGGMGGRSISYTWLVRAFILRCTTSILIFLTLVEFA
ncbi:unnamed protein product [Rotaria socialis]|uniref:Uncharacterized protein n=1 Tax=Rotaria socialis TaxID=392032 RepID=A0A820YDZ9_9BILA|nr:unnamed protein product [Rotaria socialis]CAF4560971.1 unnamed protein product [Rotaria socialis]